jgi:serine/threonine protein kinase/phenylpyruvate tautomerase PptA (4-oxalocrotonate tautomerase family)
VSGPEIEQFGRYRLLRVVGEGGMARVHLAQQLGPQGFVKPCVLKRISPSFATDEKYRRMFLQEARLSALLNHPNVVQVFDFGEVDGVPYMAMELVDGLNLSALCKGLARMNRWLPLRAAVEICQQVCEALVYAHQLRGLDGQPLNLVHRDVSPQNVLVSRQGSVKLADFGIARHDDRIEVTVGLTAKGKPGYMAPEQAMGSSTDGRTDLFAVGIVLTELISARRVIRPSDSPYSIMAVPVRVRELCSIRPEAPPSLVQLCLDLTAIDLDQRPADARAAADRLRQEAAALPVADDLSRFLQRVFEKYLPPESLPTAFLPDTAGSLPRVDPVRGDVRSLGGTAAPVPLGETVQDPTEVDAVFPAPPARTAAEMAVVREVWSQVDEAGEAQPAAAWSGWPTAFRDLETPSLHFSGSTPSGGPPAARPRALPPPVPEPTGARPIAIPSADQGPVLAHSREIDFGEDAEGSLVEPIAAHSQAPPELRLPAPERGSPAAPVAPARLDEAFGPGGLDLAETGPARGGAAGAWSERLGSIFGDPTVLRGLTIAIALAIAATVGVLGWGWASRQRPAAGPVVTEGRIEVRSTPPGARVLMNGRDTGDTTPAEIGGLPFEVPITITLERHASLPVPDQQVVRLELDRPTAVLDFGFRSARVLSVSSEPPGATVKRGEETLGVTPLALPALGLGESATITIELAGHVTEQRRLVAEVDTATVTVVTLDPARTLDVVTDPPEADVFLDGRLVGRSPLYGLEIPSRRRFKLEARRRGFQSYEAKLTAAKLSGARLEIELPDLPMMRLPLNAAERATAQKLEKQLAQSRAALRKARQALSQAEARLDRVQSSGNTLVAVAAAAHRDVDIARTEMERREQARDEAVEQVQTFRDAVLERLAGAR